jgi:hypothetical protein
MREQLEELVGSLLYEGYALYPYTPEATKNATPTPFGIAYPPTYAAECSGALDRARLECVAQARAKATLNATLRFLRPSGEGHQAREERVELGPVAIGERVSAEFTGGRFTLRSEPLPAGGALVRSCVHNTAQVSPGLDRRQALTNSIISTHVVVEIDGGTFVSPLEAGRESVNIWPVLATPDDDAVLGAPIVLPDHPQISPASHGNLFDNTEIEEALVLHVHSLTDEERAAAGGRDRAVGDMLERALALGPEEIMALHGGLSPVASPPEPEPERAEDVRGEHSASVDGVTFTRGDTLVLRPGTDRDPYDRLLDGRRATIERIYVDYDDRVHLGVTVDDDPGQQLMRETGRYLFFFANEVETA